MHIKKPEFQKQKIMLRVIYALIPVTLTGIYFFGWRVLLIIAVSSLLAFLTEWIMSSNRNGKITSACFVTSFIYALSLPPSIPLWIAAVGAVIAVLFGKEVFGGFGRNIFNPAIVGRAFIYVAFPVEMTARFVPVFHGFPGGFAEWSFQSSAAFSGYLQNGGINLSDAVSSATPMWAFRDFSYITDIKNLLIGNIGEAFTFNGTNKLLAAGSVGEVCAVVIIISAIYLLITKTAQWRLMVSTVLGAILLNFIIKNIAGLEGVPEIPFTLFSGALLYVTVFMVTDPISAPKNKSSQWIYGLIIGMLIVFFRYKSIFAGAAGFAILFGNMLSPSLDKWTSGSQKNKIEKI